MRDGPAELSSGVRATGSDRGAPRSTAMAASGDVRFGDDAGRPSGGVEPALPHYRPRDTRGRCDRGGLGEGGPALVARRRSVQPVHGAEGCLTTRTNNIPSQHVAVLPAECGAIVPHWPAGKAIARRRSIALLPNSTEKISGWLRRMLGTARHSPGNPARRRGREGVSVGD